MLFDIKLVNNEGKANVTEREDGSILIGSSCDAASCSPYSVFLFQGMYIFKLFGASGTTINNGYSLGGYVSGALYVPKSTTMYLYVGQQGTKKGESTFNGGGKGNEYGWSGGGATDLRLNKGPFSEFESLKSRIIVAAGGGGYINYEMGSQRIGGKAEGGGLKGGDGFYMAEGNVEITNSIGATQEAGGIAGDGPNITDYPITDNMNGTFGIGGETVYGSSGGGGGYFGGGSGKTNPFNVGSGSGGSSFISGYEGCKAISKMSKEGDIKMTNSSIHYSGYKFLFPDMKSGVNFGDGYVIMKWANFQCPCSSYRNQTISIQILIYIMILYHSNEVKN